MAEVTAQGSTHPHPAHAHGRRRGRRMPRGSSTRSRLYFVVWGWLFVLSACSYMVDYFGVEGYLRWSLIIIFMLLKAGLIVAVFMHMAWERLALAYAILVPPVAVIVFMAIMVFESEYTLFSRLTFFGS